MTLSIGDNGLPPIYPTPPASGGAPGEDESSILSSDGGAGDGGPDAVYEPSAPEDGEPLTYSFPPGVSSSSDGAGDGDAPDSGEIGGMNEDGIDPYAAGGSSDEAATPLVDDSEGAVDPDASQGISEEPSYDDYGISGDDCSGEEIVDPYGEGSGNEDGVAPYAEEAAGDGNESDYGDYTDYDDGSGGVPGENYGEESVAEDESVDPSATANPDESYADTSEMADAAENAAVAAQPAMTAEPDQISKAAHKAEAQKNVSANEVARPSLASALGRSHQHISLAAQLGKVSSSSMEASASVAPASTDPIYVPARFTKVTRVATVKTGPLLSPAQDPAAAVQPEAPKAAASVVAQAAYSMVGEAQQINRSVLSLLKFG